MIQNNFLYDAFTKKNIHAQTFSMAARVKYLAAVTVAMKSFLINFTCPSEVQYAPIQINLVFARIVAEEESRNKDTFHRNRTRTPGGILPSWAKVHTVKFD